MKAIPISISFREDLASEVDANAQLEKMTRSEYVRKCVRETMERARLRLDAPHCSALPVAA
jgi:metal-responsive CopG/Arc/MetJ family transcriptional regulator